VTSMKRDEFISAAACINSGGWQCLRTPRGTLPHYQGASGVFNNSCQIQSTAGSPPQAIIEVRSLQWDSLKGGSRPPFDCPGTGICLISAYATGSVPSAWTSVWEPTHLQSLAKFLRWKMAAVRFSAFYEWRLACTVSCSCCQAVLMRVLTVPLSTAGGQITLASICSSTSTTLSSGCTPSACNTSGRPTVTP